MGVVNYVILISLSHAEFNTPVHTMRRSRYIGLVKVHLGSVFTALAINVLRLGEWRAETLQRKPRHSPFSKLIAASA
jgi:hypothetical protein